MSEETKETEPTPGDPGEGVQPKTISDLDRAEQVVERRERVAKVERENIEMQRDLKAREMVGGNSDNLPAVETKKEETPKEYNDRIDKEMSEGKHNE